MILAQGSPPLDASELVLRVLASAALGGLVGLERELRDQPAGFRTHILVSLGSALFTLVGAYGLGPLTGGPPGPSVDPTRVAAQVVTGIGFLGAGAIIRHGLTVRGLTTAAALWVTAAIGMAVGLGFWVGALATTLTTVIALYGLKHVEHSVVGRLKPGHCELQIEALPQLRLTDLTGIIESKGGRMESLKMRRGEAGRRLVVSVGMPRRTSVEVMVEALTEVEGVASVDWNH